MRDRVAPRAKAIAIQGRANYSAIGKSDHCRAIPWLHERGVVLVERLLLGAHMRIARPGFRNQHGHGVRQSASSLKEQLDGVVETGRVASTRLDDGKQLVDIVAKKLRAEQRLPR